MEPTRETANRRLVTLWPTLAIVVAIVALTLRPIGSEVTPAFNWCIGCSEFGTLDLLYNIALFLPFGILLGRSGVGTVRALVLSAALSTTVELLQLMVVAGRDPSLADILTNSLGGAFGVPLARAPSLMRSASSRAWRFLGWSWVALSCGVILFGAWVVSVDVPPSDYFVQWIPQREEYARFAGDLHAFQANGVDLPAAARIPAGRFPDAFFAGEIDVSARLTPRERNTGIAYIARLALEYGEFLMVARQGNALVVRYRANAPKVGMRSPAYALAGAFSGDPRVDLEVRAVKLGDNISLHATRSNGAGAPSRSRHQRITAARFWAALLPFDRGFGVTGVLGDVVWVALLVAPAAYAAARMHSGALRALPSLVHAAGFAFIASTLQPSLWWWPVWLGFAAGALAGALLGNRSRRVVLISGASSHAAGQSNLENAASPSPAPSPAPPPR